MASCTVFSIRESELAHATEDPLPSYSDLSSKLSVTAHPTHVLELGPAWSEVHAALGNHGGDHLLGFLAAGGDPVPSLDAGPHSSGRAFTPGDTVRLLAHVAQLDEPRLRRILVFLANAVLSGHGIIVHQFR